MVFPAQQQQQKPPVAKGPDFVERPAPPPPPLRVPPVMTARLYFPFWVQTRGAAEWLEQRGCRVRLTEGSRSVLVRGPRKTVLAGMQLWQGSPVAPVDPAAGGKLPPRTEPAVTPGASGPRQNQDPVFMPPMRTRTAEGATMAQKSTTDRGDVSMQGEEPEPEPEQDFRVKFASERRARHFGSALLRKVRGVKVSFEGTTVKVRHHPRHASDVFGLAARSSRSPFMRRRGRDGSRTGGQGTGGLSFAMAVDPNHAKLDWTVQFDGPTQLAAILVRLQHRGVDVSKTTARKLTIHNKSNAEVLAYYGDGTIEHASMPKPAGPPTSSGVGPGGRGPGPAGVGPRGAPLPSETHYKTAPGGSRSVFLKYAIHFGSVLAATLADQELRRRGIDTGQLDPDGTLIVGLKEVLTRVLTSVARKYGGRVGSPTPLKAEPAHTAPPPPPKQDLPEGALKLKRYQQAGAKQGRERFRARTGRGFGLGLGLDPVAVSYAVMDFLSSEDTRRIADWLTEKGVRVVKRGANSIAATVRTADLAGLAEMVRRAHGRLKRQRAQKEPSDAASMGVGDMVDSVIRGRLTTHPFLHGVYDRLTRKKNSHREKAESHRRRAETLHAVGAHGLAKQHEDLADKYERDAAGKFASMGVTSALVGGVTRATIAVTRAALEGVMEAARQVGAKVLSKRQEVTVGGVLKTVLVVEGTRQAIKDVRRAVQEDRQAASMALPAVFAGVTVAAVLRFAGMRVAEAVAFYLASKGIDAVAKGAEVHAEVPREKLPAVEALVKRKGGRLRVAERPQQQAASMGAAGRMLRDNAGLLVFVAAGTAAVMGAQYLATRGIEAILRRGKLWVRRRDQDKAVSYLTEMRAPNASFSKYPWPDCVRDATRRYGSKERARRVCGAIKRDRGAGMAHRPSPEPEVQTYKEFTDDDKVRSAILASAKRYHVKARVTNEGYVELVGAPDDIRKLRREARPHKTAAFMFEKALPQAMTQVL